MFLDKLQESVIRQKFEPAFLPTAIPIVGLIAGMIASIPAALTAGALAIYYAARAVFANNKEAKETYWTWSADCALIGASQILNVCMIGIFNKMALNYVERKWAEATRNS